MLENHETHESIMDRIFSRTDMKSSIETFNVVQIFARYFNGAFGKWKFTRLERGGTEKEILHFHIKEILMNPDFGQKSLHSI